MIMPGFDVALNGTEGVEGGEKLKEKKAVKDEKVTAGVGGVRVVLGLVFGCVGLVVMGL